MFDQAAAADLVGAIFGATYRIERFIATGGMGAVFEASHVRLPNKRYAIKLLHAPISGNEEVRARFRREAEIACRLNHRHIVEVLDFNETPDGRPYLVMEFLAGEAFEDRLRAGRLPREEVLHILEQVAEALAAAHAEGVVHRDMKPDNIYLAHDENGQETVKVVDFGISKIRDSQSLVTRDHAVMGTVYYMSPEQAEGTVGEIDARTDIFALGTIACQALTGELPFEAPTLPGIIYKICHHDPDLGTLEPAVQKVLRRALAKDKKQRYEDVRVFIAELRAAVEGATVAAAGEADAPAEVVATVRSTMIDPTSGGARQPTGPTLAGRPTTGPSLTQRPVTGPPMGAAEAAESAYAPTLHRSDASRQPTTLGTAVGEVDVLPPRRRLVPGLALTGLLAVTGGLFIVFGGGDKSADPKSGTSTGTVSAAGGTQTDALAPRDGATATARVADAAEGSIERPPPTQPASRPVVVAKKKPRPVVAKKLRHKKKVRRHHRKTAKPARHVKPTPPVKLNTWPALPPKIKDKPKPKKKKKLGVDIPDEL